MAAISKSISLCVLWASLTLSFCILLLWMRSCHTVDQFSFPQKLADGSTYSRTADVHGGVFVWQTEPFDAFGGYTRMFGPDRRWRWSCWPWISYIEPYPRFHYDAQPETLDRYKDDGTPISTQIPAHPVRLPLWSLLGVCAAPSIWMSSGALILRLRRRRRQLLGLCMRCGYDLRSGHGVCPECGTPFKLNDHGRIEVVGEPRTNRLQQVFLSTPAIIAIALFSISRLHARHIRQEREKYRQIVNAMDWEWSENDALISHSVSVKSDYQIECEFVPRSYQDETNIRFFRDGKECYSWEGDRRSVFFEFADRLIYVTGRAQPVITAVDLKTGHEIWRNQFENIMLGGSTGGGSESIAIVKRDNAVFVSWNRGRDEYYLAVFDFTTGELLAQREYETPRAYFATPKPPPAIDLRPDGRLWNDDQFKVIVARVVSVSPLPASADQVASHIAALEPLGQIAGALSGSDGSRIDVLMRIDSGTSSVVKAPLVGSTILAVLSYRNLSAEVDKGIWMAPERYAFMPHTAAFVEIVGLDDPVVAETLDKIRKSLPTYDPTAAPAEN
jgi:hypothetical protein